MIKKLLTLLFLFAGFQANAAVMGNLTYDGTYISGDGRTYLGLDTIALWDYQRTLHETQASGEYPDFRIANTADADFFIGSLFGAVADDCSAVDGVSTSLNCGEITGWSDGFFGNNYAPDKDSFFFLADEDQYTVAGLSTVHSDGKVDQKEGWGLFSHTGMYASDGYLSSKAISWLLVRDSVSAVPEPSILALMGLGIFGIGFVRRRKSQS
jgi:hypothetical protein